ncbi:MAG TPA: porin family protein [Caulobacteraceae bacterium]|nr:porin family protein [Caulobacteraceae bacterium]
MRKMVMFAAAAAACGFATSAAAQGGGDFSPTTFYANAGYTGYSTDFGAGKTTLAALGGRVGARFGKYIGVEGEAGFGVNGQDVGSDSVKMQSALGVYAIGFIPAGPNPDRADLFARVGYGHQTSHLGGPGVDISQGTDTVNFGAGGQYFFDDKNGVRVEYTRFQHVNAGNSDADTWSLSYVRKF